MITSITVDGFRSLTSFSLNLRPGLNILVGPNGSGKTNIITFFEFLSYLVSDGPSEAVNRLGGAGSVFTKFEDDFQKTMKVDICGCLNHEKNKYIAYHYGFTIEASESFDFIRFKNQTLKILTTSRFLSPDIELKGSFCVNQLSKDCKKYSFEIENYEKSMIDSSFLPFKLRKEFTSNKKMIEDFLQGNIEDNTSLVIGLSILVEATRNIYSDLRGGQVFNIIPSKVKYPEESSSPIGIQKDGSGLAATLYAIKNKKTKQREIIFAIPGRFIIRRGKQNATLRDTSLNDVLKYLTTANSAIRKIDVENDRFDNLLKVKLWVEKEGHSTALPLSAMSDGTIKWLSLVTAILTSPSIFSIEEPENFLHPLMQSEVVSLMRGTSDPDKKKVTVLMSTHSETILNSADPSEIVVTSFNGGKTSAYRCANQKEIKEEIAKTGFGLGYYYISGSLSDD